MKENQPRSRHRRPPSRCGSVRAVVTLRGYASPTAADDLLSWVHQSKEVEAVLLIAADEASFSVPSVLLRARARVFDRMLQAVNCQEGESKKIHLVESPSLVKRFVDALLTDRCDWTDDLQEELIFPSDDVQVVEISPTFEPLLSDNPPEKGPRVIPRKQIILGHILDLYSMAEKYEFRTLESLLEKELLRMPRGLWDQPTLVIPILRTCMHTCGGHQLVCKCKEALQSIRGGDLLACLTGDPLGFWDRTRCLRVSIWLAPQHECIGNFLVAPSDTIGYLKLVICRKAQRSLAAILHDTRQIQPHCIQLMHQQLVLDNRKTIQECMINHDDAITLRLSNVKMKSRSPSDQESSCVNGSATLR